MQLRTKNVDHKKAIDPSWLGRLALALVLFAALASPAFGQIWTNNGATCQTTHGAIVQVNGSMLNSSGYYNNTGTTTITGNCTNNGTISDSGLINLAGDWINNATFTRYIGTVVMDGGAQNFAGSSLTTFYNLVIQGGNVKTFNQSENVDDTMTFTNGVCLTTQTNVLTFTTNGNWINADSISYVNGPCAKNFGSATEFRYPIGKVGRVNTCGVAPTAGSCTFRCEYFDQPYSNTTTVVAPLQVVSKIHYWNCDRISGTSNAKVRLYWIAGDYNVPSYMSDLSKIVVAMWTDSSWVDTGQNSISGSYVAGNCQSHTVTGWGHMPNQHFTIGSDSCDNSLPVELDHFAATQVGSHVELEWLTRSEVNNLGFEIERRSSSNATPVVIDAWQTDPALQSKSVYGADYQTNDVPREDGAYTYDLYQRDEDGARWHIASKTLLYRAVPNEAPLTLELYPNPAADNAAQLHIGLTQPTTNLTVKIFDVTGKSVYEDQNLMMTSGFHDYAVTGLSKLASGNYKVMISNGQSSVIRSLIISH